MSGKTGIIIQARMSSSRLPGKTLMKIGEHPLIWYVVQRAKLTGLPVAVCTSTAPLDDVLCNYLNQENISLFRGDLHDVLDRYIKTAEEFGIENIVRVTGDNPLFDFILLKNSLNLFDKYDYVDGIYNDGLIKGTGFELVRLIELKSVESPDESEKEHVTLALRKNLAKRFTYAKLKVPEAHENFYKKIVLTCDHEEDFILLRKIFYFFKFRLNITMAEIIHMYYRKPEIFKKNVSAHFLG